MLALISLWLWLVAVVSSMLYASHPNLLVIQNWANSLTEKRKQTTKWAIVRMYHVQETQPTWLLKEMHGKDSKPQVFNLNLNYVVKGGAAKAVDSVGFSPEDLPPAKPTWLPSLTLLPHHCEWRSREKKRCQAQVIRLPLMICAAVSVSSLHSF